MTDDYDSAEPLPRHPMPSRRAIVAAVVAAILIVVGLGWFMMRPSTATSPARLPASPSPATAAAAPTDPAPVAFNRRVIGDWIYACGSADGADCAITQTLTYSGAVRMQIAWRLEKAADGAFVSVWTVPTNILVRRGLVLDLGTGKPATIPLDSCSPASCEVRANLAADFIDTLRQAPKVAASVIFKNNKGFTFDFSTKGLVDALTALVAATPVAK